jgi:hypothetical protein
MYVLLTSGQVFFNKQQCLRRQSCFFHGLVRICVRFAREMRHQAVLLRRGVFRGHEFEDELKERTFMLQHYNTARVLTLILSSNLKRR